MVVVSHDRHLLRTTTDDLYLVHDKKVEPFTGDLDDYHKWLSDQQKIEKKPKQGEEINNSPSVNRKEQKRLEAEFRKKLTPYKKQLTNAEKSVDKLTAQLDDIEKQLADSALYEHTQKTRLTDLLRKQAEQKEQLEEAEMNWMDAQESIEAMQAEFETTV